MDGQTLTIVLRLFHVVAGVVWVGGMTIMAWFLLPALPAIGQAGGKFMQELMFVRRLRTWMMALMGTTVLSGVWLFVRNIAATDGGWASSPSGIGYSIGALAAIVAGGFGMAVGARAGRQMSMLVQEIGRTGGPPSETQAAEMARLQQRAAVTAKVVSILLLIAAAAMGTARYWG